MTSTPLTDHDLTAIEERAAAATPGPWYSRGLDDEDAASLAAVATTPSTGRGERWPNFNAGEIIAATLIQHPNRYVDSDDGRWYENAEFIAHARQDIPRLLAEIRRLQKAADGR